MQEPRVVNIAEKFRHIEEAWSPHIVAELNRQQVKLVRLEGEFEWHHHENEDELFLVIEGRLQMHLPDRGFDLGPGEFIIIPRGTEHRPVAPDGAEVLLFEPASTLNTGNLRTRRTVENPRWI